MWDPWGAGTRPKSCVNTNRNVVVNLFETSGSRRLDSSSTSSKESLKMAKAAAAEVDRSALQLVPVYTGSEVAVSATMLNYEL